MVIPTQELWHRLSDQKSGTNPSWSLSPWQILPGRIYIREMEVLPKIFRACKIKSFKGAHAHKSEVGQTPQFRQDRSTILCVWGMSQLSSYRWCWWQQGSGKSNFNTWSFCSHCNKLSLKASGSSLFPIKNTCTLSQTEHACVCGEREEQAFGWQLLKVYGLKTTPLSYILPEQRVTKYHQLRNMLEWPLGNTAFLQQTLSWLQTGVIFMCLPAMETGGQIFH